MADPTPAVHRDDHRPPRGYSWPPFEPGHTVSLRHGGNSERMIAARAEQVHDEIAAVAPWLDEPQFAPAVARYLAATAREQLLDEHVRRVTATKGAGAVPARVWEQASTAARLAAKLGQDLGLDPIGHPRLRAVAASAEISTATLADLARSGREVRLAAEARMAAVRPSEPLDEPTAPDDTGAGPDGAEGGVSPLGASDEEGAQ